MLGANRPAITYGLRGALSVELEVQGPRTDLHSGNFGGAIHNPLQALCEILAKLHGADQRVTIPGFYDRVRKISEKERAYMARHGPSDAEVLKDAQAEEGWGEPGLTLYERIAVRPALTINGLGGGYQGPGAKAVIPSRAMAKLNSDSCRTKTLKKSSGCSASSSSKTRRRQCASRCELKPVPTPRVIDPRHPAIGAAARAYARVLARSAGPAARSGEQFLSSACFRNCSASPRTDGLCSAGRLSARAKREISPLCISQSDPHEHRFFCTKWRGANGRPRASTHALHRTWPLSRD